MTKVQREILMALAAGAIIRRSRSSSPSRSDWVVNYLQVRNDSLRVLRERGWVEEKHGSGIWYEITAAGRKALA